MRIPRVALGPFALEGRAAKLSALALVVVLTLVTELGGLVLWPCLAIAPKAPAPKRAAAIALAFVVSYALVALLLVPPAAAVFGRVPLPCASEGALAPRSLVFCAALRNYVRSDLRDEALALAEDVRAHDADAQVRYLDGAFPLPGLPILPHRSHADGRRLDLALPFEDGTGSPLGYFGYAPLREGEAPACAESWTDLRWDLDAMQPLFGPPRLDVERAHLLVRAALRRAALGRLFLEPHVADQIRVHDAARLRFQGCHAARHDDHLHVEVGAR